VTDFDLKPEPEPFCSTCGDLGWVEAPQGTRQVPHCPPRTVEEWDVAFLWEAGLMDCPDCSEIRGAGIERLERMCADSPRMRNAQIREGEALIKRRDERARAIKEALEKRKAEIRAVEERIAAKRTSPHR
jgi:hypothetical protein